MGRVHLKVFFDKSQLSWYYSNKFLLCNGGILKIRIAGQNAKNFGDIVESIYSYGEQTSVHGPLLQRAAYSVEEINGG